MAEKIPFIFYTVLKHNNFDDRVQTSLRYMIK